MRAIPFGVLLKLRALTVWARTIPGAVIGLEAIRRSFARRPERAVVEYDRSLRIEVRIGEHMGSHLFWYGAYNRDLLALLDRLLSPGMLVLDIGANIGEIALACAARVSPGGRVYAFEPCESVAGLLRRNADLNASLELEIVEEALGERSGRGQLYDAAGLFEDGSEHGGVLTMYASPERSTPVGEVEVGTLDRFVEGRRISRLDLIKIDVEGGELAVLKGGLQAIEKFRPALLIEVQQETSRAAGYDQREILDILQPLGYRFYRVGRRGRTREIAADRLASFQNVLCVHGPPA